MPVAATAAPSSIGATATPSGIAATRAADGVEAAKVSGAQADQRDASPPLATAVSAPTGLVDREHQGNGAPIWLHLDDALQLAERRAPELAAAEAEIQGVEGFRTAADRTLHRPPRAEFAAGPRRLPGGGNLGVDVSIGVFQDFSMGGYGKSLSSFADAARERAGKNRDALRRDARVRAYVAWLDALEARELLKLRKEARDEILEVLRVAEVRVAAGRSSPGEAALARALVGSAEANILSAMGSITQADATLRHVCGIDLHQPLEVDGTLDAPPLNIDEAVVRAHVRQVSPDIRAARAQAVALERAADLGRAGSKPHLEVGPSVSREGSGDWIFLGHLRMPLPGVDPAAADNAERQLFAHVAYANVGIVEQAVLRDVEIALHEREHALRTRDLLKAGSIEPARLAVREAQLQYEAGRTDLVSVITARRELYDVLERWTRAAVDVQRSDARLERYFLSEATPKGKK